jgi:dTDP-glucose pyrophosphorylase
LTELNIVAAVQRFVASGAGAKILLKAVLNSERFSVAELEVGRVRRIVEKPAVPV